VTSWKFEADKRGAHVHVKVRSGRQPHSRGLCGKLVMREDEWPDFRDAMRAGLRGGELPEVLEVVETEAGL
jgi:hypothetical protein